jgi:hypothetical protein
VFFDEPEPEPIAQAVTRLTGSPWDADALRSHAEQFSSARFVRRIAEVVADERRAT